MALEINVRKEDLDVDGVNIYFDVVPKTYAWAFRKGETTCLGLCALPDTQVNANQLFRNFLQGIGLRNADRYPIKGALIPYGQVAPSWHGGSVLLVGDAAGLVEPLSWEGIYYALHSGRLAAESIMHGSVYPKSIKTVSKTIQHGQFCQQLFGHPVFMKLFYKHVGQHVAFMNQFYSENIDEIPLMPLWKKASLLLGKIVKNMF